MASWLNPANLLTFARLVLAPFVVRDILADQYQHALVLLAVAGVTDGLDGLVARRFGWPTRLGAYLDPIADKALLSFGYLALGVSGVIPWWLVALIFARDFFILAAAGVVLLLTNHRNFPPSRWGKLSTFFQILTAVVTIAAHGWPETPVLKLAEILWWPTAAATVWSGVHYGWRGAKLLTHRA